MVSITCELNDSNKQNNVKSVMFSMNVFELQDISVIKYYGYLTNLLFTLSRKS